MDLFETLAQRERDQRRNQFNHAANTGAFAKFASLGQGPFEFAEMIDFAVAYIEEPFMAYGSRIDASDLRALLGMVDEDTPPFPLTAGFVTEWQLDEHNYYVGAFVGVRVHFPTDIPVDITLNVAVEHYFRFEGIALKGI